MSLYLVSVPSSTSKAVPTKDIHPNIDVMLSRAGILYRAGQLVLIPGVVQEDGITGIKEDSVEWIQRPRKDWENNFSLYRQLLQFTTLGINLSFINTSFMYYKWLNLTFFILSFNAIPKSTFSVPFVCLESIVQAYKSQWAAVNENACSGDNKWLIRIRCISLKSSSSQTPLLNQTGKSE